MLLPFFSSFFVIGVAELGDKTQLLTMALSTKYDLKTVISGVFVATAVLMVIPVALGGFLGSLIPLSYVQFLAGVLFILFGVWILFSDEEDAEDHGRGVNPFLAVTSAFFLAEFGDKTQLATVALAVKFGSFWQVWLGATLGMAVANSVGVVVGNRLRAGLPREAIEKVAAFIFILFGILTLVSFV